MNKKTEFQPDAKVGAEIPDYCMLLQFIHSADSHSKCFGILKYLNQSGV